VSQLLPDGVDSLADCPFTVYEAILVALRILGYEEFPLDERPPRHMWLDAPKLTEWWDTINRARRDKYGLSDNGDVHDGDENTLAQELIKRG
jgi:hypothetical protein